MLTSIQRVKDYLKGVGEDLSTPHAHDSMLTFIADSVSAAVEKYCRRTFGITTYTNDTYVAAGGPRLWLRQWPLLSVTLVEESTDNGQSWATVPSTDYYIAPEIDLERKSYLVKPAGLGWRDGRDPILGDRFTHRIGFQAGYGLPLAVPTLVASTSGGTLATGTYYYAVSALIGGVEVALSTEASIAVTGPTGSVAVSWTALIGATAYRVYRGTNPGAYTGYFASTGSPFTDIGAAPTAGTPPNRLPYDLELAVVELCSEEYLYRGKQGVSAESFGGLNLTFDRWPLKVVRTLRNYASPRI
jgi:hypothetical protein